MKFDLQFHLVLWKRVFVFHVGRQRISSFCALTHNSEAIGQSPVIIGAMSEEDAELHASLQADELVALEAIYPSEHIRSQENLGGVRRVEFELPISTSKPIEIDIDSSSSSSSGSKRIKLSHLPPISLHVVLPAGYPLKHAPHIANLSSIWLSSMVESQQVEARDWITKRLNEMWEEVRGEILWTWGEWLREGWVDEALSGKQVTPFSVAKEASASVSAPATSPNSKRNKKESLQAVLRFVEDTSTATSTHSAAAHSLQATLSAYDRLASQSAFDKDRFLCGICLEAKRGDSCVRVQPCSHVFCRECMVDYLSLHLTEGSLYLAQSCPAPSCRSRGAGDHHQQRQQSTTSSEDGVVQAASGMGLIGDDQMAEILQGSRGEGNQSHTPHPLLARLAFLKEKHEAESDPTAVPCPRPDCQTLTGAREEDKGDRESFRQCKKCSMPFCVWCRKTWHAPMPCSLPATSSLIEKYDASDARERLVMERRFGRKNILKLKARYEEERANQEWLKGKTQPCPNCSTYVEKSSGCNHMTCAPCGTHFCYCCGRRINPAHPYEHFNTRGGSCYQKLFDGILERGVPEAGEQLDDVPDEELGEDALQRRREDEQHALALAAIQAAYGED